MYWCPPPSNSEAFRKIIVIITAFETKKVSRLKKPLKIHRIHRDKNKMLNNYFKAGSYRFAFKRFVFNKKYVTQCESNKIFAVSGVPERFINIPTPSAPDLIYLRVIIYLLIAWGRDVNIILRSTLLFITY